MKTYQGTFCGLLFVFTACVVCPATAYYNPAAGRWLNRDPIEERGGNALYVFIANRTTTLIDPIGMSSVDNPILGHYGSGPTRGKCGEFRMVITWSLSLAGPASDPSNGGIVVQYVNATFDVQDCAGNPIDVNEFSQPPRNMPHVNPGDWPFYEAWTIPPGKRTADPPLGSDVWSMPEFPVCTKGTITIHGSAEYYDGELMPPNFLPDPTKPSGGLPTSYYFTPPFSPPSSGPIVRQLTAEWNCCPKIRRDTIVTIQ